MLRQIKESDWEKVNEWLFAIAKQSFDKIIPEMLKKKVEEDYKNFPEGFIVSSTKDSINGLLWFDVPQKKKVAFIHAIYVEPEYRGKGVSEDLMKYLEDFCRKTGLETIELNVSTNLSVAIKFYEKRGFEIKRHFMSKKIK